VTEQIYTVRSGGRRPIPSIEKSAAVQFDSSLEPSESSRPASIARDVNSFFLRIALFTLTIVALWPANPAGAQIKQPGAHPHYSVDVEPHLVLMWDHGPARFGDDGIGVGLRATIPFFHNGPIPSINNDMGLSFGLDYVHFEADDRRYCRELGPAWCDRRDDYTASVFWIPVTVAWNFYFHPKVQAFGELGLAIEHASWSFAVPCNPRGPELCEIDGNDTDFFEPVFAVGGRFMLWESVGLTLRLGIPEVTAGVAFRF
jgi:hypothetical protein